MGWGGGASKVVERGTLVYAGRAIMLQYPATVSRAGGGPGEDDMGLMGSQFGFVLGARSRSSSSVLLSSYF